MKRKARILPKRAITRERMGHADDDCDDDDPDRFAMLLCLVVDKACAVLYLSLSLFLFVFFLSCSTCDEFLGVVLCSPVNI